MKNIFKIKVFLVFIFVLVLGSCTKDWEELNTNPNEPVVVPATNVLAYSLRYYCDNFIDEWMSMNNLSTYAGHLTKIQYVDESRYAERDQVINEAWRDLYTTILDLQKVQTLSEEEGNIVLKAAGLTFQAYLLQITTDLWKDVPWSNAIQGETGVTNPTYDSQESIYNSILTMLENANNLFIAGGGELGVGDLLYEGDAAQWQKFCNSLRLRVAIRMSGIAPDIAKTNIELVLGNPSTYPIFENNDDNAFFNWPGTLPYMEPWAENSISGNRDDHAMCETIIDTLKAFSDPRLPVYALPAESDGEYRGLVAGPGPLYPFNLPDISRIGDRFRNDAAGFSPLMRYSEVLFIIAEAAQKGWNTGGPTAQEAYEDGIKASMEENGISTEDADAYLANPKVAWDNSFTQIYLQKWIAIFKQGQEAWSECRRTDVPLMTIADGSIYPNHNRPPFRFKYPTDEYNLNNANVTAASVGIVDFFWGQKMWWDTRTGVN